MSAGFIILLLIGIYLVYSGLRQIITGCFTKNNDAFGDYIIETVRAAARISGIIFLIAGAAVILNELKNAGYIAFFPDIPLFPVLIILFIILGAASVFVVMKKDPDAAAAKAAGIAAAKRKAEEKMKF